MAQMIGSLDEIYQLNAVEKESDWKIQKSEFIITNVRNPNRDSNEDVVTDGVGSGWWGSELFWVVRDFVGTIYIKEINPITYGVRTTNIENVWFRVRMYGLNLRTGLYKNTVMPLNNL